jgi:hypothetical protein
MTSRALILVFFLSFMSLRIEQQKWSDVKVESSVAPKGVWGASAVSADHSMYLFGGLDALGNYSNDLYKFNIGKEIFYYHGNQCSNSTLVTNCL